MKMCALCGEGLAQLDALGLCGNCLGGIKSYLSAIGRKGGQKSRRKLTKAQARAMVRARTARRAALRPNAGTQRPGDAEATNATRATPPGSLK